MNTTTETRFVAKSLGTVSHGTCNPADLIPRFMDELDALKEAESLSPFPNVARWGRIDDILGPIERRIESGGYDYFSSDEASFDLETLFDLLQEYAPDGAYFGAHEGDGSDYGFWGTDKE
jgi:hypothetical protein